MNAQVVPNHDITRVQFGCKTAADPLEHSLAVDRSGNDHWSHNPAGPKTSNDTVVRPTVTRYIVKSTFTDLRPGNATSHGQVDAALVNEYQPRGFPGALGFLELDSSGFDIWAVAFSGVQGLFFTDIPIRRRVRQIVVSLTFRPPWRRNNLTSASNVASGRFATSFWRISSPFRSTILVLPGGGRGAGLPVRSTRARSLRTKLPLTPNCSATTMDEGSVSRAASTFLRKSRE